MKRKIESVLIPFPKGMLSSVRAPLAMPPSYARELKNMYVRADGSGSKRNGFTPEGAELVGEEIVALFTFVTVAGVEQTLVGTASGQIFVREDGAWSSVFSGLNSDGILRGAYFNDELILCNGVDDVLVWNGVEMLPITQWMSDPSTGLTRVDNDTFTIESDAYLYEVGSPIKCVDSDGNTYESTVASVSGTSPIVVNVVDAIVPLGLVDVQYEVKPPKFREVYAAHDRLWGIGDAPLSPMFSESENRMRVWYTAGVNDPTAWYDADGFLQSINLTDKTNTADELLAMRVKDGLTLFFGRENTQVWSGTDPSMTGDFSWSQTLSVGAVHPALISDMPNDIGFMTRLGLRTISRVLKTEELAVGDVGREVDTRLSGVVAQLLSDESRYKAAAEFRYAAQGWFGFYINGESFVFQVSGSGQGWTVFNGLFAEASAFEGDSGRLLLAQGGQVYGYDAASFSDAGQAIKSEWFTPWVAPASGFRKFAAMALEVLTEQEAAVELRVQRFREYDTSRPVELVTTSNVAADFWDVSDWDASYFDNGMPEVKTVRDAFVASTLAYRVTEESEQGPFTVFGLKIYGVKER